MHGIQHLFRQHALDKQTSSDSWHSAQSALSSQAHLQHHYQNTAPSQNPAELVPPPPNGDFEQGKIG